MTALEIIAHAPVAGLALGLLLIGLSLLVDAL